MDYVSTRGSARPLTFDEILRRNTTEDGGLYMPRSWPTCSANELGQETSGSYAQTVSWLLTKFGSTLSDGDRLRVVQSAFRAFDHGADGPPLVSLEKDVFALELFHGPTLAFKDYALFPLAELLEHYRVQTTVLCATSGDTGAACAAAIADRAGLKAAVLFPKGRISELQQRQITTLGASNIIPICVEGDFDQCQALVKTLFDRARETGQRFTAVNSINFARVLFQSAYYLRAAARIFADSSQLVNVIVPTGNFGNALAAYIAKSLGSPIGTIISASNANDVLPRFAETGVMKREQTIPTLAPAMDIQVSSNFERLLWALSGQSGSDVSAAQAQLNDLGNYTVSAQFSEAFHEHFKTARCDDKQIVRSMQSVHNAYDRVVCPHSATAYDANERLRDQLDGPVLIVETAHPAKFPEALRAADLSIEKTPNQLAKPTETTEEYVTVPASPDAIEAVIGNA